MIYWKPYNYRLILFSIGLVNVSPTLAQTADSIQTNTQEAYIEKMRNYVSLKLGISDNVETFVVSTDAIKYDLRPNDKTVTRIAFNYRFVSFSLSATPKFIPGNNDNNLRGKSKSSNYSLNLNFDRWMQALSYTKSKGYYLENTRDYRPGWQEGTDPYIQFPYLIYQCFQGQTAFKFNRKFSFNAVSTQTERQLKSAGTFLPAFSYRYYIVDDKAPLTASSQSQKSSHFELLLSASYYYSFVLKQKFYASAGISPGGGIIFAKLLNRSSTEVSSSKYNNPIFRLEAGVGLGYNGERFFAGGQVQAANTIFSRKDVTNIIQNERAFYQFFVGYRFAAPGFLKKMLDKAEEKQAQLLGKE